MAENKDIKYINKDFGEFKTSLIEFAKTYYPNTYNDFSETSPGMMFMEMASYVGDVLSFYLDNQIQENFIEYARQQNNIYSLAYMLGYKPKATSVATVNIEVIQEVPSKLIDGTWVPDLDYALYFSENTIIGSNTLFSTSQNNFNFLIQDNIDFSFSSSSDPLDITVASIAGGNPDFFQLKKTRKAISSTINTTTFTFGTVEKFPTIEINAPNIIGILDIVDSDGNTWYEVPYLAQEMIFDTIKNTNQNTPTLYSDSDNTPYLLQLKKVQRRFVTRLLDTGSLQIQFGAGTTLGNNDEEITPNPNNVGLGLPYKRSLLNTAFSPTNFLFTDTYGIAPSNTTLTVRYLTGGGVTANVPANTLNKISSVNYAFQKSSLDATAANYIFNQTVTCNNPRAADGGGDGDTLDEIKFNSLMNFSTQLRSVTQDDYTVRALSLPSDYGVISKVYTTKSTVSSLLPNETPTVLDFYILSYDTNKNLKTASDALKQNLLTYISQYRVINDSLRIKDAFIINIGVEFEIIVLPNFNSNLVLTDCITALQDYFNIDKWQINEPILLKDLFILLDKVNGVQTVKNVTISNKVGTSLGYSQYGYDIPGATQNNVIYPSLDPMIFEVKYPNTDIKGRVVTF